MKKFQIVLILTAFLLTGCKFSSSDSASPIESVAPPTDASVIHLVEPGDLPADRSSHAGDIDSSTTAKKNRAPGGDRHTFERYERPFNADTMDVYFPELDILDTLIYQDETWVYGVITLRGFDSNTGLSGTYGFEFDLDHDGNGEWLVLVDNPSSEDWTTDGVRVYNDRNDDVGGKLAMFTDEKLSRGDGYEVKVFDAGMGNDPDFAWVRISPDDPLSIQIAIKASGLGVTDNGYLVSAWAGHEALNPAEFDLNDHFTHDQAGASDKGLEFFYPIKEVSELDNTCRMAVGYQPTGGEPGLCKLADVPEDSCGGPPPGGCCAASNLAVCILQWNEATCSCQGVIIK